MPRVPGRAALSELYTATAGAGWTNAAKWTTNASVCEWAGVYCSAQCRVQRLQLSLNGLVGTLPESLAVLTALQFLDVRDSNLAGTLSPRFAAWTAMTVLNVSWNARLSGSLPPSYAAMTQLQVLLLQVRTASRTSGDVLKSWCEYTARCFQRLFLLVCASMPP